MKLLTEILPRRDGTVRVAGKDGAAHVFIPDTNGDLTCDVPDATLVATLLATDNFWPADQADYENAVKMVKPVVNSQATAAVDHAVDFDEDDSGDDPVNLNALPVEAGTPPAPAKKQDAAKVSRSRKAA